MDTNLNDCFNSADEQRAYEEFCAAQDEAERFQLDKPVLVCRWRMAKRRVPMLNRHIRALSERLVQGKPLTHNMLSWAKQHVEWSLENGTYEDPNGVLMLVIDVNGNAAMTVGAYEPLADTTRAGLEARAATARAEQAETCVAPELLCAIAGNELRMVAAEDEPLCGTATLVEQLAATRGCAVERVADAGDLSGAVFLVSDEHGVVPAADEDDETVRFLANGCRKLFS